MNARCRHCKAEAVASTDRYVGTCLGDVVVKNGQFEFEPAGYTEIHWDSCEQVGWECRNCFFTEVPAEGEEMAAALARLVEVSS